MRNPNDYISVTVTTYNDENEIRNLLDDILSQTQKPDEIIIADGGSKDDTVQIIHEYVNRSTIPIILLTGKRLNISQGLNSAIKNSSGDYIAIMSTGNRYEKSYLEELCITQSETGADVVFPPIRGSETTAFSRLYCKTFLSGSKGNRIPSNHGGLIRRKVFQKIGLFYEAFIYAGEDSEFYNRVRENGVLLACAEKSRLAWDVPHDIMQFKKQLKNYIIATLQIEPGASVLRHYRRYFVLIGLILLLFLIAVLRIKFLAFGITAVLIFVLIREIIRNGLLAFTLTQYKIFYQLFLMIKFRKYFAAEYQVDANMIEKLKY